MAHDDGKLYWHDPDPRAVFPLDAINPDKKTAQQLRSGRFEIRTDTAFEAVVRACSDREETWIDERIIRSYIELHGQGNAHSVEVWKNSTLVGGIYGVGIGGAFFGESMFNRRPNMGKLAFYSLVSRLKRNKFLLFDTQYINPFTEKLGAKEIARDEYLRMLAMAIALPNTFR